MDDVNEVALIWEKEEVTDYLTLDDSEQDQVTRITGDDIDQELMSASTVIVAINAQFLRRADITS